MTASRAERRRRSRSDTAATPVVHTRGRIHHRVYDLVRRHPFAVAAALVLLHVALALLTFQPQPHTGGDNAAYLTLARSLLETGTYTELWDPSTPPHTKYPPVFPGILTVALALGLQSWVRLKLVVLACSATAVAASFLWLRRRRSPVLALGIGLLLAISPGVLRESRWVLSDVPFWALTMLALLAFERVRTGARLRFALGTVAVVLAFFTRTAGLPLALAAILWLALRRRWLHAGTLALAVGVPALLWWLRGRAFGPAGYVSEFWLVNPYVPAAGTIGPADLVSRMIANVGKYASIHLPILLTGTTGAFITLLAAVILLLGLAGWLRALWSPRRLRVADLFLPLYLGLILVWPEVWSGERFLLPALPLVLYYAGGMLLRVSRTPRVGLAVATSLLLLLSVLATPALADAARAGQECTARYRAGERYPCLPSPAWDDFFAIAGRARQSLPPETVVLSRKPRLFYVLSGLRGTNYPLNENPAAFWTEVERTGARFVVLDAVDAVSQLYLLPVVQANPASFCVQDVFEGTGTALLGIAPDLPLEPGEPRFRYCPPGFAERHAP